MARGAKTGGRTKGTPNKTTALLRDAILQAATDAGEGDLVAYLKLQALANPGPFLSLLGKVLPMQIAGEIGLRPVTRMTDDELEAIAAGRGNGTAAQTESPRRLN